MRWKNDRSAFGAAAKMLHWAMAILLFTAWAAVEYRQAFTVIRTPPADLALQVHLAAGLAVGVLILPRLAWRLYNVEPAPIGGGALMHFAASAAHWALYLLLFLMPVTGYLGSLAPANFFSLFTVPQFSKTALFETFVAGHLGMTFAEWEKPVDFVHKKVLGSLFLPLLIVAHVGAALYHHFVLRDATLIRMLPARDAK